MQPSLFRTLFTLVFCTLMSACSTPTKSTKPIKNTPSVTQNHSGQLAKKPARSAQRILPVKKQTKRSRRPIRKQQTFIFLKEGAASYYGKRFQGRKTASGERFDMHQLTAAHKKLPFGTRVRVTNLQNNRSVVVTINDRGPHSKYRIIDLSKAAAQRIGMLQAGVVKVKVEILL